MYPLVRVGGSSSFIFNALGYLHILICSLFGVISIIAKGPTRWIALAMVFISWPYFWFDRYRSKMLALLLPGFAAFTLVGKRSLTVRLSVSLVVALALGIWFSRVMDYRSGSGVGAFLENETALNEESETSKKGAGREGQDMFKELCWINTLISSGRYPPNWGKSYLSEILNPIPRSIWPNKPLVGIDYAIARGFGKGRGNDVFATISTGMIGQGCVNFGPYLGVLAAAYLFALWAAFLSRLWCQRYSALRLGLFLIGMGLTLNTGRDFTLLVLFPFLFGYIGIRMIEWHQGKGPHSRRAVGTPPPRQAIPPSQP